MTPTVDGSGERLVFSAIILSMFHWGGGPKVILRILWPKMAPLQLAPDRYLPTSTTI